jgi:hypothetical protein
MRFESIEISVSQSVKPICLLNNLITLYQLNEGEQTLYVNGKKYDKSGVEYFKPLFFHFQ